MLINHNTPQGEGILTVQLSRADAVIPYSIDFVMASHTINVNFWLVQTVRMAVPMLYSEYDRNEMENKIGFIKVLRLTFQLGLKEAKDIAEWFMDNVDRNVQGKF